MGFLAFTLYAGRPQRPPQIERVEGPTANFANPGGIGTAPECIDHELASDRLEIHQANGTGYVFDALPTLEHLWIPGSVRRLAGEVIDAVEHAIAASNAGDHRITWC